MSNLIINESTVTKKKEGGFRKNAQTFFLTYPKCPLEPQLVIEKLNSILEIETYLVAQEKHMDGDFHIHAYIKLKKIINIKDNRKLDITVDTIVYHPNIQGVRSPSAVLKYITKDGKYVSNMSETAIRDAINKNIKVGDLYKEAMEKAKESVEDGMKILEHTKTFRDLAIHGEAIEKNLRRMKKQKTEPKYSLEKFNIVVEWNKELTLILWGPTNTGKTSLAKALLPNALFVRHIDALKDYKTGHYEGIIFDDMSFKHWPIGAQIHLVDTDNVSQINVKHSIAIIPEGTPRIITTNMMPGEIFSLNIHDPEACPLTRRIQQEWIENKVY